MFTMQNQPELMVSTQVSNCGQYALLSVIKGSDGYQLLYVADLHDEKNKGLDKALTVKNISSEWIGSFNYITNHGKEFYFGTNIDAPRKRVIKLNIDSPAKANWTEIIPENKNSVLTSALCSNRKYIVTTYMEDATE